jgi:hypothetical protein
MAHRVAVGCDSRRHLVNGNSRAMVPGTDYPKIDEPTL